MALIEALASIYWVKKDLRRFLDLCLENSAILSTIDWENNTKYTISNELIGRMMERRDIYHEDILRIINEILELNDFSHLLNWDDGEQKEHIAKQKVASLRKHAAGYFELEKDRQKAKERQVKAREAVQSSIRYNKKLDTFREKYAALVISSNPQKRGYELEKLLNELFIFFDLDPKSSFKIVGEQIDGAFTFDNNDYLLEAKWQNSLVSSEPLYAFGSKVSGKLKTTLGLFISINGFSEDSTKSRADNLRSILLMDGQELMAVLEGRIKLPRLLYMKRRHASQTGNIYYRVSDMFN